MTVAAVLAGIVLVYQSIPWVFGSLFGGTAQVFTFGRPLALVFLTTNVVAIAALLDRVIA